MGRKRTSNKADFTLSIDKNLIKKLKALDINSSALFTQTAKKLLEKYDKDGNIKEDDELWNNLQKGLDISSLFLYYEIEQITALVEKWTIIENRKEVIKNVKRWWISIY